jgi:hypothetical protein
MNCMFKQHRSLIALSLMLCIGSPVNSAEIGASDSHGIALTIYNQNFGLVKDNRTIDLAPGINFVRFEDVAAQIDPTSVSFQSLTAPNKVTVREQNYQYDLMDPQTILSKSVGKQIKFRQYLNGQVREMSGVLLNSPVATVYDASGAGSSSNRYQGLVVRTPEGVILNPAGEIELTELPAGLVAKPSLLWKLETDTPGKHETEIAYQTAGMGWKADYVAVSNNDDTKMDLTSWVTLDNKSGAAYKNAALKLIAGDVHKVTPPPQRPMPMAEMAMDAAGAAAPQFKEQSFAEYHMYSLQGKTDLNQNETKQLSLFNAANVPVKKTFVYEPEGGDQPVYYDGFVPNQGDPQKVKIKLEVENKSENQLGMPLPKGKVRVYKKDADGALQFIGEDLIDHTPRNEKIRLYIGDAFDLVGERTQTNYVQVNDRVQRLSYTISLRNRKTTPVTITAVEHAYGQWKIVTSSHPYTKKDSRTFEFAVPLQPNSEVKVNYTIEIKS